MVSLLIALTLSAVSLGQDIQQSECISPRGKPNAPVGVIYLHGQFPPRNLESGNLKWMADLERTNRKKLQDMADKLGVRVAVPVSQDFINGSVRTWRNFSGADGLVRIEEFSQSACKAPLAPQRHMIGFSDGGLTARNFGLSCATKRPNYSSVLALGANPPQVDGRGDKECASFIYTGGANDKVIDLTAAEKKMAAMRSLGRDARVLPKYPGRHEIPSGEMLAQILAPASTISAPAATAPAPQPRQQISKAGTSSSFFFWQSDVPAGR